MAKNPLIRLIDAVGDRLGTSHYRKDLKLVQTYTGLVFDRANYERYAGKVRLHEVFHDEQISQFFPKDVDRMTSCKQGFKNMCRSVTMVMRENGFVFTREMIAGLSAYHQWSGYGKENLASLHKVAHLQRRGIRLPPLENEYALYDLPE